MAEYIEREKLIRNAELCRETTDAFIELINDQEAADVQPVVQGKWHAEGDGYADGEIVYDMWSCSCCGEYFDEWDDKPTWNYCPNCGADMREANDGD